MSIDQIEHPALTFGRTAPPKCARARSLDAGP